MHRSGYREWFNYCSVSEQFTAVRCSHLSALATFEHFQSMEKTLNHADRDATPQGYARTAKLWMFIGATLFVAILYWAQAVLIPIALATLLTFLLAPLVSRLQRWGIKRGVS